MLGVRVSIHVEGSTSAVTRIVGNDKIEEEGDVQRQAEKETAVVAATETQTEVSKHASLNIKLLHDESLTQKHGLNALVAAYHK